MRVLLSDARVVCLFVRLIRGYTSDRSDAFATQYHQVPPLICEAVTFLHTYPLAKLLLLSSAPRVYPGSIVGWTSSARLILSDCPLRGRAYRESSCCSACITLAVMNMKIAAEFIHRPHPLEVPGRSFMVKIC